jgi:diguanylate cyclase (GGDEF)-like protein
MERSATGKRRYGGSGHRAVALAWVLLLVGTAASGLGGLRWSQAVHRDNRAAFNSQASAVAGAVATSWQRDLDLTAITRTIVELNPDLSSAGIATWFATMNAATRYPGAIGGGYIERVTGPQLAAWVLARSNSEQIPAAGLPSVIPAGDRQQYCLMQNLTFQPDGAKLDLAPLVNAALERIDWCQTAMSPLNAVTTSDFAATPFTGVDVVRQALSKAGLLATAGRLDARTEATLNGAIDILAPVFDHPGTATPNGWVDQIFNPEAILRAVPDGSAKLNITLSQMLPTGPPRLLAHLDANPRQTAFTKEVTVAGDGTWLVSVSGNAPAGHVSALTQSAGLMAAGVLVSLLLFGMVRLLAGSRARALALVEDKTSELRHRALHDSLTGLPNRALVLDRVERALTRAQRDHTLIAAAFIDLDNFKDVNDSLGHKGGDELLQAVGARLRAVLRPSDTVGRLGGNEFVVVAEGTAITADPELLGEHLLAIFQDPFHLGRHDRRTFTVSASVGIATGMRATADELLRDADVALHQAKATGKNRYAVFHEEMQQAVQYRLDLEMDLRDAVGRDQFFLAYQPTFGINDGVVTGVEALLRWQHPTRGVVVPDLFIPSLETSGLIVPVGRWVLGEACRRGVLLGDLGYPITMAVNVSARQLNGGTLVADVADALDKSGLDPSRLVIEITEGTLMTDAAATTRRLDDLKALGVRIAIDDFGTGYSSLAYLRQFPVDILKIDRSFIQGMMDSHESVAVIHTLVQLGKSLGLETIAEGIEEPEQLDRLRHEQCDTGQGYIYAKPLSPVNLERFLARCGSLAVALSRS